MSRFIDKLHKVSQGEVHHMGFGGTKARVEKIPAVAIVASIPVKDSNAISVAAQGGADAILLQLENLESGLASFEEALKLVGDLPIGVSLETPLPEDIEKLSAAGADFIALRTETAPAALLRGENVGKLAIIDPHMDDSLLRALDKLAIDAVIGDLEQGNEEFFTVQEIIACRRLVDFVRKPVILRVSNKLTDGDLATVRDMGIESIVVDLSGPTAADTLARLRKAVSELPPRRKTRESMEAILPRQSVAPKEFDPEDEEL